MGVKIHSNANKQTKILSVHDTSIDVERSDIPKYLETYDEKYLKFRTTDPDNGEFGPTEFWCRALSWSTFEPIVWECVLNHRRMAIEAARYACNSIENARYAEEEDGKRVVKEVRCLTFPDPGRGQKVSDATFYMIDEEFWVDVGVAVLQLSGLTERIVELLKKVHADFSHKMRIVPREQEKNSSSPALSIGSENQKESNAGGASKILDVESA